MKPTYWDGVLIGALASGFAWRIIFFIADDIRAWWKAEGRFQWNRMNNAKTSKK